MPEQYTVPQFIDAEDRIIGPITARQFIILMVVGLIEFALFKLAPFVYFLAIGIPLIGVGGTVAFMKVNGAPFHYFLLNLLQTMKRPRLRVWNKAYTDAQLKELLKQTPSAPAQAFARKEFAASSHLQELTLVVNTG